MKEAQGRFRALGNMGDVLIKMDQVEEAIKVYQRQLTLSKQTRDKRCEATAYGSLGVCHRLSKQFDKALGYHTQVGKRFIISDFSATPNTLFNTDVIFDITRIQKLIRVS